MNRVICSALIALAVGMSGCASAGFGKRMPLGAPVGPHDVWTGYGPVKTSQADGAWSAVELTSRLTRKGSWLLGPHFAVSENHGDADVALNPSLGFGKSTTYRWFGDEWKLGATGQRWNINPFRGVARLDTARLDWGQGKDEGHTPFYTQKTHYEVLEMYLSSSWFQHQSRWWPQRDIWLIARKMTSFSKDSFVLGKPASDAADSQSRWSLGIAQDLWQVRRGLPYRGPASRFAVGIVYERSHWWADDSDRDMFGARLRYTKRWRTTQLTFDLMPVKNVGDSNFKGILFGVSYSWGGK